ncbi:fumarate reductase/succinate dehydrogenase flavoprotein subunit, partial [bacterium]|nr:fumarate reductase/succinate dehydrogenase flavoprotein subunit [bacterium]
YTMGGLWVDYNLMSTISGLFVLGEANFSDHGANRLGASALMQGLADGYFVIPYTIGNYLAGRRPGGSTPEDPEFKENEEEVQSQIQKLLSVKGKKSVSEFHRELGLLMWDYVGMSRNEEGLQSVLKKIPKLKEEFWNDVLIPDDADNLNKNLEFAGRVADYFELGELMAMDAHDRRESCGGHFREEYQTPEGEARRNDDEFLYVAAWEYKGKDKVPQLHKEPLRFENVKLTQRSYK